MKPAATPGPEGTEARRAEDICLACGLCCSGALFQTVSLDAADAERLSHKLPIHEERIHQPCPAHAGDAGCTIYEERPVGCSKFACTVLKAVSTGAMTWDDAAARIARTRDLIAVVRRAIGGTDYLFSDLGRFVEDSPDWRDAHRDLLRDAARLRKLLLDFVLGL